jgi:hypothetical protein
VVVCCLSPPARQRPSCRQTSLPGRRDEGSSIDAERTEYAALSTDDAARRFIDLFWGSA